MLSKLLLNEFDIDCRFITDKEFILQNLRIEITQNNISIMAEKNSPIRILMEKNA